MVSMVSTLSFRKACMTQSVIKVMAIHFIDSKHHIMKLRNCSRFNLSHRVYITPLVINDLGQTHTHAQTDASISINNNFNKPNTCQLCKSFTWYKLCTKTMKTEITHAKFHTYISK